MAMSANPRPPRTLLRAIAHRIPRVLLLALLSFSLLLAAGCSAAGSRNYSGELPIGSKNDPGTLDKEKDFASTADSSVDRKVISTATATLAAEDVKDAMQRLTAAVMEIGGYVAGSTLTEVSTDRYRATITLKVPTGELEPLIATLEDYGTVRATANSTQDVTEDYYDVQARLKNALAQEEQLLAIMKTATTVQETLQVRAELDKVQETIEQHEGRIRLWDSLIDMATLTITLEPTAILISEDTGFRTLTGSELWKGISKAFRGSIAFLVNAGGYLLIALSATLVPLLLLGLLLLVVLRIARNQKKRRLARQSPPSPGVAPPRGQAGL